MTRRNELKFIVEIAENLPVSDWKIESEFIEFLSFNKEVCEFLDKWFSEVASKNAVAFGNTHGLTDRERVEFQTLVSSINIKEKFLSLISQFTRNTIGILRAINKSGADTSELISIGLKTNNLLIQLNS